MKNTVIGRKIAVLVMAALMVFCVLTVSASAESSVARMNDAQTLELTDPDSITDANATAGGNVKLMITFEKPLEEGYEVQINFTTESGVTKTFTAQSQVIPMQTNYSCIPIRDMFDKLGLGGKKLTSVTFTGRSAGAITGIEYVNGLVYSTGSNVTEDDTVTDIVPDANPATGVENLTFPIILSCLCAAAAIFSMKNS